MKRLFFLMLVVYSYGVSAQLPNLKWLQSVHMDVRSMITDADDNLYVAGDLEGTCVMGNDTLVSKRIDVVIVKYDTAGNFLWYKQIGGIDLDNAVDIKLDKNNNVYLSFLFDFTTTIEGDSIPYVYEYGHRPIIIKYSPDGEFLWWKIPAYNNFGCFHPRMFRIDQADNLIIADDIYPMGSIGIVLYGDSTIADTLGWYHISKYNSDGVFQWMRTYNNEIKQIVTDRSNNILFIQKTDTNSVFDFKKLSPNGSLLWSRKIAIDVIGLDSYYERWLPLLAVDRFKNIYLATHYDTVTLGSQTFFSRGGYDILLIKYDSLGNFIWGKSMGGPYADSPTSLFVVDDKILMTGSFRSRIYFSHDSIIGFGATSYFSKEGGFIVEYDLNAENEFVKKIYAKRGCKAVLVTMGKSIYLYGSASDSTYFDDYLWQAVPPTTGISYLARFYNVPPLPEIPIENYLIYPNPTIGTIHFDFNSTYGKVNLQIYNLQGALVKTYTLTNHRNSIDLSFLANGMYFVKIISDVGVKCAKFEKI